MTRVVVLRPEPAAGATAERLRDLGFRPVLLPLFEIEPVAWTAPDPVAFDALLLTSANAIRMGGEQLSRFRGLPVHAVGEATADAAREAGFDVASRGDGGIDRLLESLGPDLRLLHLCGEDRREPRAASQSITRVIVYRSKELPEVDVRQGQDAVVLVHSPRAGHRFAELVGQANVDRRTIRIAAISSAAADAAGGGWADVEAAQNPTEDVLLALAARLCNKPPPQ
jgi:uroporphyrinogen-III synthase